MKKPNVLLITGDHARHDAVAANHDPKASNSLGSVIKTPNLDRLANDGVSFANSFTTNPICVPGRASITTGNYPHKATGKKGNGGRIKDDQPILARDFAAAGYATYAVGKLHYVPYSPPGEPRLLHGFQKAELCEEGRIISSFDPLGKTKGLEDYHDYLESVGWGGYERAHCIGNNDVHPCASPMPAEHHEESWVANRTIANLSEHLDGGSDKPFLMWMSFTKPHPPYDPPRPYDDMYDPRTMPEPLGGWENDEIMKGRDRELENRRYVYGYDRLSEQAVRVARAYYCGMMSFQDEMIGKVLDFLEEKNVKEETIVIYTADHGDLLGDFGRFFKTCMIDGSVKVPFIWRVPGLDGGDNHRRIQLVGLQDVMPTLCSLCGVTPGGSSDGIDLTPILQDEGAKGRDFYVSQTCESPGQKYMIRTPQWKYIYSEIGGVEELYDSSRDDYELDNLAGKPESKGVLEQLRKTLLDWCVENGDDGMVVDGKLAASGEDNLKPRSINPGVFGWRKY